MTTTLTEPVATTTKPPPNLKELQRVREYIALNFRENPTLADLAGKVSRFHLHRAYTRFFGETPKATIARLQIDEAKRLMLAGVPLADIADKIGLSHHSHFTSRFRQLVGTTPLRWLREQKGSVTQ